MTMLFLFCAKQVNATNTGRFTISTWVNPTTSISSKAIISKAEELRLVTDASGNPLCQFKTTTWQTGASSASALTLNSWQHIICTYDLTNIKIYVNGVLKGTTALTAVPDDTSAVFYAGRDASASTTYGFFSGLIDDYKFYNYNLTLDEILTDYNSGSALILGSLSTGNSNSAPNTAGSQEYCIPGDTGTNCSPPVGRWDFNEGVGTSAYDTSGNGNNGVLGAGSSAPTWTAGKVGKGLRFDGVNDYVDAGYGTSLDITSAVTVEVWVKTTVATLRNIIFKGAGVTTNYGIEISSTDPGKLRFFGYASGVAKGIIEVGGTAINDNIWHQIVGTFDGTNWIIYIDGRPNRSKVDVATLTPTTQTLQIGSRQLGGYFNGLIDQVRIYNYARTPAQIAWDYSKGAPIAYYDFNECQGTTARDAGGVDDKSAIRYDATINIGSLGSQSSLGTCADGSSASAWGIGSTGKYGASINLDGTDDYVSVGTAMTASSLSFWVKPSSTTTNIMQMSTAVGVSANSGVISVSGLSSPTIYLNGTSLTSQTTLSAGVWKHVVITTATAFPATAIKFGQNGSSYLTGHLDEIKIWNYPLTSTQVKTEYNQAGAVRFGSE